MNFVHGIRGSASRMRRSATMSGTKLIAGLDKSIMYYMQPTSKNINTALQYNSGELGRKQQLVSTIYRIAVGDPDVLDSQKNELRSFLIDNQLIDRELIQTDRQLWCLCQYLNSREAPLIWTLVPDFIDHISCLNLIYDMEHVHDLTSIQQGNLLNTLNELNRALATIRDEPIQYLKSTESMGTEDHMHETWE